MRSPNAGQRMDQERSIPLTSELALDNDHEAPPPMQRTRSATFERVLNVIVASVSLVIASPLMLVCAVMVRLTSAGPILYTQPRIGIDRRRGTKPPTMYDRRARDLGGAAFKIYKFRTMYVGAESRHGAVWATQADRRVTPVGRVMRKLRFDELPQLFNVLRGDMNIVGPRPERPSIFSRLRGDVAHYHLRQRAKPGITGWAQINQSYDTSLDDVRRKVRFDLEYLERQSVSEDLLIMAKTLPVILFRRGGW